MYAFLNSGKSKIAEMLSSIMRNVWSITYRASRKSKSFISCCKKRKLWKLWCRFWNWANFWTTPNPYNLRKRKPNWSADIIEPETLVEAEEQWKLPMDDQIHSLTVNNTWVLVNLPEGKHTILNKYIFEVK